MVLWTGNVTWCKFIPRTAWRLFPTKLKPSTRRLNCGSPRKSFPILRDLVIQFYLKCHTSEWALLSKSLVKAGVNQGNNHEPSGIPHHPPSMMTKNILTRSTDPQGHLLYPGSISGRQKSILIGLIDVDGGGRWNILDKLFSGYAWYTSLCRPDDTLIVRNIYIKFFICVLLRNVYQAYHEKNSNRGVHIIFTIWKYLCPPAFPNNVATRSLLPLVQTI